PPPSSFTLSLHDALPIWILIVSDTHKAHGNLERVLEKEGPVDMMIHLGDVEGIADYIEALAGCPVHMVSGNNDFFSHLPWEEELDRKSTRLNSSHVSISY